MDNDIVLGFAVEPSSREELMPNLQGRIALVSGASQGIGRACALELARAGATVALAARNEAKLDYNDILVCTQETRSRLQINA